jgi:hypothetical protein
MMVLNIMGIRVNTSLNVIKKKNLRGLVIQAMLRHVIVQKIHQRQCADRPVPLTLVLVKMVEK